tara:strand:+ start:41343 stop:42650 length:1308 start_codon:yes stop_codon:yes gene_type:complete
MIAKHSPMANRSIQRHLTLAAGAAAVLIFGAGGWAATTELSGAVLANGRVVVDTNVKRVQHPLGGVVSTIEVRNGQRVQYGQVLVTLDATLAKANLAVITKAMDALVIKQLRLEAERDGLSFALPPNFENRLGDSEFAELLQTEMGFFKSRSNVRAGLRAQLEERILQMNEQAGGMVLQAEAYADTLQLITDELAGVEQLYEKRLVGVQRMMELKREEAENRGMHSQTLADIAKVKGQMSEIRLQILQIDEDLRAEATGELRQIQEKTAELVERRIAALDQVQRIDIRSPVDGVVHQLALHTLGGVIDPGETLMIIVPDSDDLSVEVRIEGQDIDQIHVGQPAFLRMSAFNQRTTPELEGVVKTVAADLVEDQKTGMHYYPARITLRPGEVDRLGSQILTPGMPVETFVQTSSRTVLSYLLKPVTDYLARAFRTD